MGMYDNIVLPWPEWKITARLGHGSFGSVYKIERQLVDMKEECALKIISIPQDEDEISENITNYGYDRESLSETYKTRMQDVVREYELMARLSTHPNIVGCRDIKAVPHTDGIGWDVFIRMDLLTPLMTYKNSHALSEKEVLRLGLDMCGALEACEKLNIIHRDVKPENIMVDDFGHFRLGDFGVARTMEHTTSATKAGTERYMAPEVLRHEPYGKTVDIYSLGLVLYWLLNNGRLPFVPAVGKLHPGDEERAQAERLTGEEFPAPANGGTGFFQIIKKACRFKSSERYADAESMRQDLERLKTFGGTENGSALDACSGSIQNGYTAAQDARNDSIQNDNAQNGSCVAQNIWNSVAGNGQNSASSSGKDWMDDNAETIGAWGAGAATNPGLKKEYSSQGKRQLQKQIRQNPQNQGWQMDPAAAKPPAKYVETAITLALRDYGHIYCTQHHIDDGRWISQDEDSEAEYIVEAFPAVAGINGLLTPVQTVVRINPHQKGSAPALCRNDLERVIASAEIYLKKKNLVMRETIVEVPFDYSMLEKELISAILKAHGISVRRFMTPAKAFGFYMLRYIEEGLYLFFHASGQKIEICAANESDGVCEIYSDSGLYAADGWETADIATHEQRIRQEIRRVLKETGIMAQSGQEPGTRDICLRRAYLAGGVPGRMEQLLRETLPFPVVRTADYSLQGGYLEAAKLSGRKIAENTLLLDALTQDISIGLGDNGEYRLLFPRNSTLPCGSSKMGTGLLVSTETDVRIYEGNYQNRTYDRLIRTLNLQNLREGHEIFCFADIDTKGSLHLEIKDDQQRVLFHDTIVQL